MGESVLKSGITQRIILLLQYAQQAVLLFQLSLFHRLQQFAHVWKVLLGILEFGNGDLNDFARLQELDEQLFGMGAKGMFGSREVMIGYNEPMDDPFARLADAVPCN